MMKMRIGVVSDTHGLLRPEARAFLLGCDHIVHAGDICDENTLKEISKIAPVTAVRGNNDKGAWAAGLSETEIVKFDDVFVYVIHDLAQIDIAPDAAGVQVVVSGHTHKPLIDQRAGVFYVNPGSAGPRRFRLPISIGELTIEGTSVRARTVELMRSD